MVRSLRARLAERNGVSAEEGQWYVVHTYSGHEAKVKKNLESRIETMDMSEKIFEVIVPTEEEIEIHNGQRRTVNKKVYPGYVLVKMKMDDDSWYVVRNTPGVTSFVGMGTKPTPLRDDEVSTIKDQMTAEAPRVKLSLAVGDNVRIVDGPFQDFEGRIDEVNQDRGRVKVLVSMFGRETAVELDFLQVDRNL
ncbi:MAG: transcription termination/antitermination protein NusG [Thermomicrobiales bacterium]